MSVGIGSGIESALYKSIKHHHPDHVVFITTKASEATLERIVDGKKIKDIVENTCLTLEDENDIIASYNFIKNTVKDLLEKGYSPSEIYIDFTTGTKVMSAALAAAALMYNLSSLTYVYGQRDKNGRVISGTERIMALEPLKIILDIKEKKDIPTYFNVYQFNACLETLKELKAHERIFSPEELERINEFENLIIGFQEWDRFDHEQAKERLSKVKKFNLKNQLDFLDRLIMEKISLSKKFPELKGKIPTTHLIVDLLANAERRADEGNYDDAVARLYRIIEMIGQFILLNEFKIDSSNVDIEKLKEKLSKDQIEKYQRKKDEEGKIKLGLKEDFELISELDPNNRISKLYSELKDDLKKCLRFRNCSILAHGFNPIHKDEYEEFHQIVIKLIDEFIPNYEEMLENSKFIKI
ncbi:MAG: TIGR02710 family CRISPR-associated CARF protein [Nitrososphaerales archaeon]